MGHFLLLNTKSSLLNHKVQWVMPYHKGPQTLEAMAMPRLLGNKYTMLPLHYVSLRVEVRSNQYWINDSLNDPCPLAFLESMPHLLLPSMHSEQSMPPKQIGILIFMAWKKKIIYIYDVSFYLWCFDVKYVRFIFLLNLCNYFDSFA